MWDLPRPGLEHMSPALAGRFSTTAPPGKPQKFLTLMKSSLSIVFFMDHAFGVVSKKSSPYPRSSRFSLVSSLKSFIALHFAYVSVFVKGVRSVSRLIFLYADVQLF